MAHDLLCESVRSEIEEVCHTFHSVLVHMGFEEEHLTMTPFDQCALSAVNDDYDGEERITGCWLSAGGEKIAHFIRYANGSMFAEKDVLKPHPTRSGQFVEAIEVWGYPGRLKHDVRLLPSL